MDNKRILTFMNCFCCSKTFNVNDLIELKTNSLVIGSQTVEFSDLLLDVCLFKVSEWKAYKKLRTDLVNQHFRQTTLKNLTFAVNAKTHWCNSMYSKEISKDIRTSSRS